MSSEPNTPSSIAAVGDEPPIAYRVIAAVVGAVARLFARFEIHRLDLAHQMQSGVVVANHRSLFDVAAALVAFHRIRRYPRVLIAGGWFERRSTGWLLRLVGAIPIDRGEPGGGFGAAVTALRAGQPLLVLPEGRLHFDPAEPTMPGRFKTGAARIAHQADQPMWAIGLDGTERVWSKGTRFPRTFLGRRPLVRVWGDREVTLTTGDHVADTARLRERVHEILVELDQLDQAPPG